MTDDDFEKAKSEKDKTIHIMLLPIWPLSARYTLTKPIMPYPNRAAIKLLNCCAAQ